MADTKITGLTNFDSSNTPYWPPAPASDVIPIVDVSDTTMAGSGTTKKISINNLLSSSPTATGAFSVTGLVTAGSAAITGAATVGTTLGVTGATTLTGNVGVGATPSAWTTYNVLQVNNGSIANYGPTQDMRISSNAYYASGAWKRIAAAYATQYLMDGSSGTHLWYVAATGAADSTITTFSSAAMTLTTAGNLAFPTGKGIDFSAVTGGTGTATANVLNDYEEGTWTIGISFGGAATGITYTQNTGKYTKVGRLVTVFGAIDLSAKGTSTGNAAITGLPFSIAGASSDYSAASLQLVNITFADFPMGFGNPTTTTIPLQEVTNAGVRTNLTDADFANNSAIIFSLTYSV